MKIDAHIHIHDNFSAQDLISYLDKNGFDACWLMTWEEADSVEWPYLPLTVEAVTEAHARYPQRIFPMYAPDPLQDNCLQKLTRRLDAGFSGCAELKAAVSWDDSVLQPLLAEVNRRRLPLTFHMEEGRDDFRFNTASPIDNYWGKLYRTRRLGGLSGRLLQQGGRWFPPLRHMQEKLAYSFPGYMMDIAGLERAVKRYPAIKFVGHGPFFWKNIADPPGETEYPQEPYSQKGSVWRLLGTYSNLYADLSGRSGYCMLKRDRRKAQEFLTTFADRLLFGSDNFFADQQSLLSSLKLSAEVYRRIYGENALALTSDAVPNSNDS